MSNYTYRSSQLPLEFILVALKPFSAAASKSDSDSHDQDLVKAATSLQRFGQSDIFEPRVLGIIRDFLPKRMYLVSCVCACVCVRYYLSLSIVFLTRTWCFSLPPPPPPLPPLPPPLDFQHSILAIRNPNL
jgi:hypothetical protein